MSLYTAEMGSNYLELLLLLTRLDYYRHVHPLYKLSHFFMS